VMMGVGHWFIMTMCFYVPLQSLDVEAGSGEGLRWIPEFQAFGLTPPIALALFAFQGWEMNDNFFLSGKDFLRWGRHALGGLAFWSVAGVGLWVAAVRSFREMTGRGPRPAVNAGAAARTEPAALLSPGAAASTR
jgi:hypothetical protein